MSYRNLEPPALPVSAPARFVERSNIRRSPVNWNEESLPEAAKSAAAADYHSWEHAMWLLAEANGWMKPCEPIRMQMLV